MPNSSSSEVRLIFGGALTWLLRWLFTLWIVSWVLGHLLGYLDYVMPPNCLLSPWSGCSLVESHSSKRIFTWARPILAQANKFPLKLEKKLKKFIFAFESLVYYCFLKWNSKFYLKIWLKELSDVFKWILRYILIVKESLKSDVIEWCIYVTWSMEWCESLIKT